MRKKKGGGNETETLNICGDEISQYRSLSECEVLKFNVPGRRRREC